MNTNNKAGKSAKQFTLAEIDAWFANQKPCSPPTYHKWLKRRSIARLAAGLDARTGAPITK